VSTVAVMIQVEAQLITWAGVVSSASPDVSASLT
jgi:hypothetical protein